jgi:hypothetical protein
MADAGGFLQSSFLLIQKNAKVNFRRRNCGLYAGRGGKKKTRGA